MKSFIIIFVLIVSSECGLLDDLVNSKEQSQGLTRLLNKKPQNATESNKAEHSQGVILKVRQTLENGTKIVIDALGNVIRIHPKENEENSKTEVSTESTTSSSSKDNEIVSKDDSSKSTEPKTDLPTTSTEKVKVEGPKPDENQNKTLPTEVNAETKNSASNVNENVKNTTDTNKVDGSIGKNCTAADGKACDNVKMGSRTSLKGDECPTGKSRADDGTCVEEIK